MEVKNICTKSTYKEKTYWNNVGVLKTTDEGKQYISLNMFPDTPFYVFERKEKQQQIEHGKVIPTDLYNQDKPPF